MFVFLMEIYCVLCGVELILPCIFALYAFSVVERLVSHVTLLVSNVNSCTYISLPDVVYIKAQYCSVELILKPVSR